MRGLGPHRIAAMAMADAPQGSSFLVTQIVRNSFVDGPGSRTTVFFKGCPLRCPWCHNPETQLACNEIFFDDRRCMQCGLCAKACPVPGAVSLQSTERINRSLCTKCMACCDACPTLALEPVARVMTAEQLVRELRKDRLLWTHSGGGVTFSGGEPLFQEPESMRRLLQRCHDEEGMHVALDTCGAVDWARVENVLPYVDLWLWDVKHSSRVDLGAPLANENLRRLMSLSSAVVLPRAMAAAETQPAVASEPPPAMALSSDEASADATAPRPRVRVWVRVPCVPSFNASPEECARMGGLLASLPHRVEVVHLLPFHRFQWRKYAMLGRGEWPLTHLAEMDERQVELCRSSLEAAAGQGVTVGGEPKEPK